MKKIKAFNNVMYVLLGEGAFFFKITDLEKALIIFVNLRRGNQSGHCRPEPELF